MSGKTKNDFSWISDEIISLVTDDELDDNKNKHENTDAIRSTSFGHLSREKELGQQNIDEIPIQRKNDSNGTLNDVFSQSSVIELDSSDDSNMKSIDLETSFFDDIISSDLSEISDSLSSKSSSGFLADREDSDDKSMMMTTTELHKDKKVNLANKSLESTFVVPDDSSNQTIKSSLNYINQESQYNSSDDTSKLIKLINFIDLLKQLRRQPKVVLKRCKTNCPSSQTTHLTAAHAHKQTIQSEKQYKRCKPQCSSCKALPRNLFTTICNICGSSMIYNCLGCDFSSSTYITVYSHYRNKHMCGLLDRTIVYCLFCDKKFRRRLNLYYHYKKYHAIEARKNRQSIQFYTVSRSANNKEYQCYKCDYSNLLRTDVKHHIRTEHDPTMYKPRDKTKKPRKQKVLNKQVKRTTPAKVASNVTCKGSQDQNKYCTSYCSSCSTPPRKCYLSICEKCGASIIYRCRKCNYISNKYRSVFSHYYDKHRLSPDRVIHCLYCDEMSKSRRNLHQHYAIFHAVESGKTEKFQQFLQFYTVSKSENNEKYQCYKCDYRSSDLTAVKSHIQAKHDRTIPKLRKKPCTVVIRLSAS